MEIIPINGHLIVKPVKHESLLPSEKDLFEQIGEVMSICDLSNVAGTSSEVPNIGERVYFDPWQVGKYPSGEGDEEFWVVPFKHIKAIERKKDA